MKRFCFVAIFIFVLTLLKGQQKTIDSLFLKLNSTRIDTQKVTVLNAIFNHYSSVDNDSAEKYAQKAYTISDRINFDEGKIKSISNLGTVYFYQGKNAKALKSFLISISLIEKYEKNHSSNLFSKRQLSSANNNIGLIYQRQHQYYKAEEYFRQSIAIDEITGDKKAMAHSYNNIGTIKENLNDYNKALENYELALKYKIEIKDSVGLPSTLINIGIIYMNQKKFDESSKNFIEALRYSSKVNDFQDQSLALINLGDLYYLKKDYLKSIPYYEQGIEICKKQKYIEFVSYAYESLSLSYYKLKNFEKAYQVYRLHVAAKDTLFNQDNTRILHEMTTKYETESKEKEIKLLTTDKELQKVEIKNSKIISYSALIGILFFGAFAFYAFYAYRQKKKTNQELDLKNQKIEFAYKIIEEHQKEVLDSINYAKRIQYALLAHENLFIENVSSHFIFFKPKDIVSGDFYWATEHGEDFYLAVCDSTGHGVPGAFMSLLSIGFLSEAIKEKNIQEPNKVFDYVRKRLIESISNEDQKDGFDGILLRINKVSRKITYAAANNRPVILSNGIMDNLNCDKMPVGKGEKLIPFSEFGIEHRTGDTIYLYTDGYADQFGGTKGKKFKYKPLNELLMANASIDLKQQSFILDKHFVDWKGNLEQVDDVLVIGIKL